MISKIVCIVYVLLLGTRFVHDFIIPWNTKMAFRGIMEYRKMLGNQVNGISWYFVILYVRVPPAPLHFHKTSRKLFRSAACFVIRKRISYVSHKHLFPISPDKDIQQLLNCKPYDYIGNNCQRETYTFPQHQV